jgi:C4-dicarboxylate transporter, DctM subunit
VLIVLGALMDSISATLIFAPLLAPIAQDMFGIDPLHFGIVFVVNMEIGYLMPPVATNLFVASAVFKRPFSQVTRAVMPTLGLTCAALALVMYLPTISLLALNLRDGKPLVAHFPWHGKDHSAAATAEAPKTGSPPSLKSLTGKMLNDMGDEKK